MRSALVAAIILTAFVLVSADVYTECDYGRLNSTKGIYLGTLAGYNTASSFFDNTANSHSLGGTATYMQLPIRAGYAFNEYWTAYFLLPLGQYSESDGSSISSDFGLSNPWLIVKWIRPTSSSFSMGPRLGFRFPFASSTTENVAADKLPLGDKNFALDLGVVGRSQPESRGFRFDTSLGVRYYMEASYDIAGTTVKSQPGFMFYISGEPGFAWGRSKNLASYLILRYENQADSKADGQTVTDSSWGLFNVGLKQDWMIDQNNCLELRGCYPVMGHNALEYLQIALGYNGIIPSR